MNTVIFLTKDNKAEMAEAIKALAARQLTKVNGALVIAHQTVIPSKEAQRIARPLIEKFQTTSAITSSGNFSLSQEAQIAAMFARFAMLAYSRFPGGWLILDEPTAPLINDWSQAVDKLHKTHGGRACGLARQDGKTTLTHGPITLQIPWQTMKMFRFSTNESWRSRGRYLLIGAGFQPISEAEAVFCKVDEEQGRFRGVLVTDKPEYTPTAEPVVNTAWKADPAFVEGPDERAQLSARLEEATGKRPHHFTGIDKLRQMVQALDQPAQA
jgi:hypothetical protein